MNKAFIFDMDGVLINTEQTWVQYGSTFLPNLLGTDIAAKIGDTIGMTINTIYEKAVEYGFSMDKGEYVKRYDKQAKRIYDKAPITEEIDTLAEILISHGFKLALVSSSRQTWINYMLPRLSFRDKLEQIISLNDRPDLKPKPYPDGYLETMRKLESPPQTTVILEDSNSGIQSAKSSGAFVIGFKQNLVPGYQQKGADIYAENIDEVIKIVESI